MKTVQTIHDFAKMHLELGLPMPSKVFQETIPMPHRISLGYPTVHQVFVPFYDEETKCYVFTHEQALATHKKVKKYWDSAVDVNYKGLRLGGIFKNNLVLFSQTDEGKAYGLQASRNFRLGGAIHFETNAQAERFLADWAAVREALTKEEEE